MVVPPFPGNNSAGSRGALIKGTLVVMRGGFESFDGSPEALKSIEMWTEIQFGQSFAIGFERSCGQQYAAVTVDSTDGRIGHVEGVGEAGCGS